MATVKYTGARYIPKFFDNGSLDNPTEWRANTSYEPIEVCQYQGNTYISKQPVPKGIGAPSANPNYWLLWADPNAQMEELRQLVANYIEIVEDVEQTVDALRTNNCVLFGDSYLRNYTGSDYTNPGWGDYFIAETGFNEIARYKSGGAGWVQTGTSDTEAGLNFLGMLERANNNLTDEQKNNVDFIVIQGLINDLITNIPLATIIQNIHSFCNNARTYFPNAKIIISTALCSDEYQHDKRCFQLYRDLEGIIRAGAVYATQSIYWFRELVGNYGRGDDVHANENGYRYLARLMARVAMGEPDCYHPFFYQSGRIRAIIRETVPNLNDFATIDSRFSFIDGVFSGWIRETINDPTVVTEDTWIKLPIFAFDDTEHSCEVVTTLSIPPNALQTMTSLQWLTRDGYLYYNLHPSFRLNDGTQVEYTQGMIMRTTITFPMGGY